MAETTTTTAPTAPKPTARKKQHQSIPFGQLHIQATFNNTIVSFADKKGNVLITSSAGANGFRGSKKGTAYASQIAAEKVGEIAKSLYGVKAVDVFVKGVGLGRDAAIRAMGNFDISVDCIKDVTAMSHGGVRPRRERRT